MSLTDRAQWSRVGGKGFWMYAGVRCGRRWLLSVPDRRRGKESFVPARERGGGASMYIRYRGRIVRVLERLGWMG